MEWRLSALPGLGAATGVPAIRFAQAIVLFLATTSFLFTTPGVGEPGGGGFPAISLIGEFLLKDIPLLGLSFWTLAGAIRAARQRAVAE